MTFMITIVGSSELLMLWVSKRKKFGWMFHASSASFGLVSILILTVDYRTSRRYRNLRILLLISVVVIYETTILCN